MDDDEKPLPPPSKDYLEAIAEPLKNDRLRRLRRRLDMQRRVRILIVVGSVVIDVVCWETGVTSVWRPLAASALLFAAYALALDMSDRLFRLVLYFALLGGGAAALLGDRQLLAASVLALPSPLAWSLAARALRRALLLIQLVFMTHAGARALPARFGYAPHALFSAALGVALSLAHDMQALTRHHFALPGIAPPTRPIVGAVLGLGQFALLPYVIEQATIDGAYLRATRIALLYAVIGYLTSYGASLTLKQTI